MACASTWKQYNMHTWLFVSSHLCSYWPLCRLAMPIILEMEVQLKYLCLALPWDLGVNSLSQFLSRQCSLRVSHILIHSSDDSRIYKDRNGSRRLLAGEDSCEKPYLVPGSQCTHSCSQSLISGMAYVEWAWQMIPCWNLFLWKISYKIYEVKVPTKFLANSIQYLVSGMYTKL